MLEFGAIYSRKKVGEFFVFDDKKLILKGHKIWATSLMNHDFNEIS